MRISTTLFALSMVTILCLIPSCSSMIDCEQIEKRHTFILMDLSDKDLYKEIETDLTENFPSFMERTELGNISACESFALSFAHFGGQEILDISTQAIAINRKGLSREEEKRMANPKPLVQLMKKKLEEYNRLTDDPVVTSSTSIANVLLKSITQADLSSDNVFLIMTDGVENNPQLNLYKDIPEDGDYSALLDNLIEPSVLEKYRQYKQQGLQAKVIMVLKNEPVGKVDRRKIKAFWIGIFEELELNYQFIDNLSNQVEL